MSDETPPAGDDDRRVDETRARATGTPDDTDATPDQGEPDDGDGVDRSSTVTIGSAGFDPGDGQSTTAGVENAVPRPADEFDWRGWVLVAVVVVSFLVVPVVVALRPLDVGGFRTTYLVLPLVPAFLLGATAVWVAVRSRQGDG